MKAALNRIAALLGYVPAPAKLAASTIPLELKFQIDTAPLDAAIAKLDQVADAARRAEAAINETLLAQEGEFITSELASDDTQALILAEMRKQTTLLEVLAKQGDWAAKHERYGPPYTGTGSSSVSGSSCLASASPPPS